MADAPVAFAAGDARRVPWQTHDRPPVSPALLWLRRGSHRWSMPVHLDARLFRRCAEVTIYRHPRHQLVIPILFGRLHRAPGSGPIPQALRRRLTRLAAMLFVAAADFNIKAPARSSCVQRPLRWAGFDSTTEIRWLCFASRQIGERSTSKRSAADSCCQPCTCCVAEGSLGGFDRWPFLSLIAQIQGTAYRIQGFDSLTHRHFAA